MSTPIPYDPTWVDVVVKPTDGDSRSAANMNVTFEALKWRTDHLYVNSLLNTVGNPGGNPGTYLLTGTLVLVGATPINFLSPSSRSDTRVVAGNPSRNPDSWWAEAEQEATTPRPAYKQKYSPLSPDAPWLVWRMRMPKNAILKSVTIQIAPSGGHGGNVPDDQPILRIWKCTTSSFAAMTSIASVQDAQPNFTAYETAHELAITGLSYSSWGANDMLVIGFRGEEGNNATAAGFYPDGGLRVFHPRIVIERGSLDNE